MNIQWDKAPEGVLAFHPAVNGYSDHWVKWDEKGNNWFCVTGFESGGWVNSFTSMHPKYVHEFIYRNPKTCVWNGQGLPPVGTVCEYLWLWAQKIVYVRIKVLSHDEERAQFRVISGGGIGSLRECNQRVENGQPMFRPIRTPDQIAAEERLQKAIELYGAVMNHSGQQFKALPAERQQHYLHLIDAGWQKVTRA